MKRIILALWGVLLCIGAFAQVPQYALWNPAALRGGQNFNAFSPTFLQAIYHPADFPSAPAGRMTNIYFRIAIPRAPKGTSAVYYGWRTRIGNTSLDTFKKRVDTAIQELMTIMEVDSFVVPHSDSIGAWVRIPLGNKVFNFSRMQNFVVEYAFDSSLNGFALYNSVPMPANHWRYIVGSRSTMIGNAYTEKPPDLGFDIIPLGVKDAGNIRSFGLFPNPANGRIVVSFQTREPVKQVRVALSNMLGQIVQQEQFTAGGTSFFREIALRDLPKGIYSAEIEADGERVVRRLQVE